MGQNGGGAIHNWSESTLIRNTVFRNNVAENSGGAIYTWGKDFQIIDCDFMDNHSEVAGGAIHINSNDVRITNGLFENNSSGTTGGAVNNQRDLTVDGATFKNNKSTGNGGAINNNNNIAIINSTEFIQNETDGIGGAVYNNFGTLTVTLSDFTENNALEKGGAIGNNFGTIDIRQSGFTTNNAQQEGGAIYNHRFAELSVIEHVTFSENSATHGGAIFNFSEVGLHVVSSLFRDNQATDMGGAIFNNRFIEVTNATFVGNTNTALIMPSSAQSVNNNFKTHVYNSVFYLNTAKSGGYRPDIHSERLDRDLSTQDVRRNILQAYVGTNNQVGVDPLFVNNTNDFRLQVTSPAVNAGNNALFDGISPTAVATSTDLDDVPRLYGAVIDLGAYELQNDPIPVVPNCGAITAPTNNATGVQLLPAISWNTVSNATGYRLTIGTSSTTADVLDNHDVGNVTSFTLTTALQPGTVYYIRLTPYNTVGGATGCAQHQFTTIVRPEPPRASDQTVCPAATVANLLAIGVNGSTVHWYSQITGGTALPAAAELITGTYYVSQTLDGLESDRVAVMVDVGVPAAPQFSGPVTACGHVTVADLATVGTDLRWYSGATGGQPLSDATVLSTGTYYASRFTGACESNRTAVQIIVHITPIPQVPDQSFTPGSTFADLTIIGQGLQWYTDPTGGSPFDPGTVISNGTFYVSQTIDGCESNRVIVDIEIVEVVYNIVFDDATLAYNGEEQSIVVGGQLPPDARITYSDNSRRSVGNQTARATISAPNFQTVTLEARLTIVPVQLLVQAVDVTKDMDRIPFHGGNGVTFEGFVSGDAEEDMIGQIVYSGNSQGAIDAGEYDIEVSGLINDNYDIHYLPGKLSIRSKVIFPNVITPSLADGKNDTFAFRYIYNMVHAGIIIFNIDGMEVYSSLDYQDNFTGRGLNRGTYFYVVHYTLPDNPGRNIVKNGFLTIL